MRVNYGVSSFRKRLAGLIAVLLPAMGAHAQLEEIVVTAQKREESLQDVPISVVAFTSEMLRMLDIEEASDLVLVTPGLQANSQAGSHRNYFLRGVGTADFHLTSAPAIGQYYDGITLTSGFQARAALFDMERVEILKGPQNTLFGLNTTGGAVNYISRLPEIGAGTNGFFDVETGSDSLLRGEAAVGFDIGDTVAARIAAAHNSHDGFRSVTTGRDHGNDDMQAFRAALAWESSDRSSLTVNFRTMQNRNNGDARQGLGTRDPSSAPAGLSPVCPDFTNRVQDYEQDTDCVGRGGAGTGLPPGDPSTGDWDTITTNYGIEDLDTSGFYVKYDHDYDWGTLNLSAAYDNLDFEVASDTEGGPTVGAHLAQADDRDTNQYEIRFVSGSDDAFRWIAGVYYLDEEADSYTGLFTPGQMTNGLRLPNVQLAHSKENLSVYGQGELDLGDRATVTAGLRWSDEELQGDYLPSSPSVAGTQWGITQPAFADTINALVLAQRDAADPNLDQNGFDVRRQVSETLTNEDTGFTLKLDWAVTDDSMLYASYSKGFKGGALDIRAIYALTPVRNLAGGLASTEPESLDAFETGYKASFMDNRVSLDASAFMYDYKNLARFSAAAGVPVLENAPGSEVSGFDANMKYANDAGFYLDLGVSLMDSEVTDATGSAFVEGASLGNTPDFSISAVAAYDFDFANGNLLTIAGNVNHVDDFVHATIVGAQDRMAPSITSPAYTIVSLNATYRFGVEQQYALSFKGNNLTDEHYCNSRSVQGGNTLLNNALPGGTLSGIIACGVTRETRRNFGVAFSMDF